LGLTLPTSISLRLGGLKGKGKLIIFTCTAIGALTMAVVTFLSKGDGLSEVSTRATAADRAGPVGLLDTDYRHLVTVGKIATALRPEERRAATRAGHTPKHGALRYHLGCGEPHSDDKWP
jgi:hypothetical protein